MTSGEGSLTGLGDGQEVLAALEMVLGTIQVCVLAYIGVLARRAERNTQRTADETFRQGNGR